uniref:SDE2-like domain-containing protein n=1 Tax=Ciona savignyi TaxID=51511 RepID=H2YGT8_CIOSA
MDFSTIFLDLSEFGCGIKHLTVRNNQVIDTFKVSEKSSFYFTKNGLLFTQGESLRNGDYVRAKVRFLGGKGGFGSMLRALGSQIEKTTNKEACRDLSGRRMRDVNNEKKMFEYVQQKAEKEKEKEKKKMEKLEKCLEKPKHFFNDPAYEKSLEETSENVENALKKGLVAHKRKAQTTNKPVNQKKKKWLGFDDDIGSSSDSDDDDNDEFALNCRVSKNNSNDSSSACSSKSDEAKTETENKKVETGYLESKENGKNEPGTEKET